MNEVYEPTNDFKSIMKHITLGLLSFLCMLASCYEDKGNYDYTTVPEITFSNVKETYDLLRGIDDLAFKPTITSSTEGEIAADNPNYEFACILQPTSLYFDDNTKMHDLNPDKTKDFIYHFTEPVGTHKGVYSIKDKRTGVTTYYRFTVNLKSSAYEGWMILCNEGDDNLVRMDMVSVISRDEGRISPVYKILNSSFPEEHNARQIMFDHSMYSTGDYLYLMSETGSYKLDKIGLTAEEKDNVAMGQFLSDLGDDVPIRFAAAGCGIPGASAHMMTTKNGNAYINDLAFFGSAYEFPANAAVELGAPQYHVSPYIGVGMSRSETSVSSRAFLLYDTDNKRFMGWDANKTTKLLYELPESGATHIPFKTGKDLVYMEGTRFGENSVFNVLQDADGSRSVLVVDLSDNQFRQTNYYENITAEHFNEAEHFTFHSVYPYMFYSYKDKLYSYNFGTLSVNNTIALPGEEITMVKIDLFKWLKPTSIPDNMKEQEHYILVGSYRQDATDDNGGILRMYKLDNATGKLNEVRKYEGFAKIVDVTYRERF